MKHTATELKQKQSLPLEAKIKMSITRIKAFYENLDGDVYVSFSGGKDSTVLLHLVRSIYPDVKAVFVDTGLEFPEIKRFVRSFENVEILKPKMPFPQVLEKYGYPVISKENAQKLEEIRNTKSDKLKNKRLYGDEKGNGKLPEKWKFAIDATFKISGKCCNIMKKNPARDYEKKSGLKPFIGTMASDSWLRRSNWLENGCNSFNSGKEKSNPLSFWLESDIWDYLKGFKIPYAEVYDMGYERTGCVFCMFGLEKDETDRFEMLKKTHPKLYAYCMNKLGLRKIIDYIKDRGIQHTQGKE